MTSEEALIWYLEQGAKAIESVKDNPALVFNQVKYLKSRLNSYENKIKAKRKLKAKYDKLENGQLFD